MVFALISLGCPKNQVDADVMCRRLLAAGHTTTADLSEADMILVNTCGFIDSAKSEAIENILMACEYKKNNPAVKVVVTGCLAQRYQSQIADEIPEVDGVVGLGSSEAIVAILERIAGGEKVESYGPKTALPLGGERVVSTPRHYAYLKIAEGCNNCCHYCAIPSIRGPLRSRTVEDCVAIFGDDGLILAVLMGIPFNLLVYTLGAKMVCMDIPKGAAHAPLSLRSALLSPINAAIVLSLIFYFGQIPVPSPILTPIQHLSNVTTPLSMFVTGMNLAQGKVSDTIRDKDAISACAVRLLLFPVIAWAITLPFPSLSPLVVGVTLVTMAMPAPAASTIMGEQYGGCTQVGARIVFLSSLLCILTIPLVSLLL